MGFKIPTLLAQGATRAAYCQKVNGASSLGRRKIRYSLVGSTVLVFEFQSAACLFFRFLNAETKNPQRRAKLSINLILGKREMIYSRALVHKPSQLHAHGKPDSNEGGDQRGQTRAHQGQRDADDRQDAQ